MTLLQVKNIAKNYENQPKAAVNNVSFDVKEGEILALVGESGSGKSTLLNLVAGLLQPDEGEVLFHGEQVKGPVDTLVPGHEEIKVVFQQFDLMPFHTVEENIRFVIRAYEEDFQLEKLAQLEEVCALKGFLHKKPGELSGGQQQRVAIAKALALEPELLLMDEPFSSVDSQLKAHLEAEVFDYIKSYGMTCVFVTHDHQDALALSERIIVLRDGQKVVDDRPEKIYYWPIDAYVASFFGAVNILKGKEVNQLLSTSRFSDKKEYLIRGECIKLVNKGMKAAVKQILFKGHYDKLIVKAGTQKLQVFASPKQFQIDQEVFLAIDENDITPLS